MRRLIICILLLTFISGCKTDSYEKPAPIAKSGKLDLSEWSFQNDGAVRLDGEWIFYWGSLTSAPSAENSARSTLIKVPGEWNRFINPQTGENYPGTGYATYLLTIKLPPKIKASDLTIEQTVALTSFRLYENGRLLREEGKVSPDPETAIPANVWRRTALRSESGELQIVYQLANFSHRTGGLSDHVTLGLHEDMHNRAAVHRFFRFLLIGMLSFAGIYHIILFLYRINDVPSLLLSLFCFIISFRSLVTGEIFLSTLVPDLSWETARRLDYFTLFTSVPLFGLFIHRLYAIKWLKAGSLFFLILPLPFLSLLILPPLVFSKTVLAYQVITLLTAAYCIVLMSISAWKGKTEARIGLCGVIILILTVINDTLYSQNIILTGQISEFGFMAVIITQSISLSRMFASTYEEKAKLSSELEKSAKRLMQERERIYSDLHDHLGAKLTDALHIGEQISSSNRQAEESRFKELINTIKSATRALRERLVHLEDLEELSNDFFYGLNLYLLRRYSYKDRTISYNVNTHASLMDTMQNKASVLFSVVEEIASNDLKYGTGRSDWNFEIDGDTIRLHMRAKTDYNEKEHPKGNGSATIQSRIQAAGGEVTMQTGDYFQIEIII